MRAGTILFFTASVLLAGVAGAQGLKVKCIGDSITEGLLPFDEENRGGYPSRLQPLLRQGGLKGAQVRNHGVGGDDSFEVLARIGSVVTGADIVVLLAGTNDVSAIISGRYLLADTIGNLNFMLGLAENRGARAIVGTVPPRRPGASRDNGNSTTVQMVKEIRQMAHNQRFEVVDFWHEFPHRERSTYAEYYYAGSEDTIGHPNAAGFERMAQATAGVILEGDSQSPVDGRLLLPDRSGKVNAETDYEMELYDFDSGILLASAILLINGEPLETTVTGSPRKAKLFAAADGRRRCKVLLSVRATDRAEPPNELDFFITKFPTPQKLIEGDLNGDCRVDGRDLAIFGPVFGKTRTDRGFDEEMDLVENGVVDGDDFARLAAHFGRGDLAGSGS
jgi:lysophospholipase L1-like esterase